MPISAGSSGPTEEELMYGPAFLLNELFDKSPISPAEVIRPEVTPKQSGLRLLIAGLTLSILTRKINDRKPMTRREFLGGSN